MLGELNEAGKQKTSFAKYSKNLMIFPYKFKDRLLGFLIIKKTKKAAIAFNFILHTKSWVIKHFFFYELSI